MGLWITKKLIELHNNGTVEVISKKDEGTTFLVEMNLDTVDWEEEEDENAEN